MSQSQRRYRIPSRVCLRRDIFQPRCQKLHLNCSAESVATAIHPFCRCRITCVPVTEEELDRELDELLAGLDIPEVQNRYYQGTRSYDEFLQKGITESYFYISQFELQQFLYDNFTKGNILFNGNGTAIEIFDFGKPIAHDTLLDRDTSLAKAKYLKSRTHFSPFSPRI